MCTFFTPYTYLFFSLYLLVITSMFSVNDFLIFWLFIEITILLLIGMSYTVFIHSYTQLMLYFLFQILGSFSVLVFYLFGCKYLLFSSLLLNLGIFPFFSWYINVLYRFPSFVLFVSSTLHKLPPLYILYILCESHHVCFLLAFCVVTLAVSSIYMLYINDLRYLVIVSSVGNSSFIVMAVLSSNLSVFLLFYTVYMVNMYLILTSFSSIGSHSMSYSFNFSFFVLYLLVLLLNLASFPPFPGFFTKFLVFYTCMNMYVDVYSYFILLIIFNVVIMVTYIIVFLKYIVNIYSTSMHLMVY